MTINLRQILREVMEPFSTFVEREDAQAILGSSQRFYDNVWGPMSHDETVSDVERIKYVLAHFRAKRLLGPGYDAGSVLAGAYDFLISHGSEDDIAEVEDMIVPYVARATQSYSNDDELMRILNCPNIPGSLLQNLASRMEDPRIRRHSNLGSTPSVSHMPHPNIVQSLWDMLPYVAQHEVKKSINEGYRIVDVLNADMYRLETKWRQYAPDFDANTRLFSSEEPGNAFSSDWVISNIFAGFLLCKHTPEYMLSKMAQINESKNENAPYRQLINSMIEEHPSMAGLSNMDDDQRRAARHSHDIKSIKQFIMGEV